MDFLAQTAFRVLPIQNLFLSRSQTALPRLAVFGGGYCRDALGSGRRLGRT